MKVLKKGILCCMIVTILALGFGAGAFAARKYIEVPPADMYVEKQMAFDWLSQPEVFEKYGIMSDVIWSYAELGMQEFKSSKLVADELEKAGFKVERGMAGMPTCFVATYGSGKPVIAILCEYDALPMLSQKGRVPYQDPLVEGAPGHGCGHNLQGPTTVAAAIAVKQAMDRYGLRGTVKVLGSPAEETLVSRAYMVPAGLFDDVDAVLYNHGDDDFGGGARGGVSGNAMFSTIFRFKGVTAHGAGGPWDAKSALDAVEIMSVATNFLREHLFYTYRMHYVIPEGGEAPNVVPDRASVWYFVRNTDDRVEGMFEKVVNCAKGAALSTGTELSVRVYTAIHQRHTNGALTQLIHQNSMLVGMPEWTDEEQAYAKTVQKNVGKPERGLKTEITRLYEYDASEKYTGGGSSDVAEVSLVTALGRVGIPQRAPGTISHHWDRVASSYGSIAWKAINASAKAHAGIILDIMTKPEVIKEIRDEFEVQVKEFPYKSYLPPGTEPPNDLNAELMEKWAPKLEPTYIEWPY